MNLERLLKIAVPVVAVGMVTYKLVYEFYTRQLEREYVYDVTKLREKGLI